ncbi:hypothetical protein [Nitrosococcus watsonii]|uniref:Uncharacterized protein n=1 Tax=Nitrosococcus watsoni (strain C-113) TaxID=105559 RepID=D8K9C8_NITWC|nr:hypothetical protein [Nitrosococcus watsonii]ADJ29271.1 hypothetical protein Nwat_2469 [Nitrosococcus watsonii C-113]
MNDDDITTLLQAPSFLDGPRVIEFFLQTQTEHYDFIRRTLIRFAYHSLPKPDKGLLVKLVELHGTLSGLATKNLCERAWLVFEQIVL